MPTTHDHEVVIGVDGSAASVAAARYGVAEAGRTGARARLVHVLPDVAALATGFAMPVAEVAAAGRIVLRTVRDEVAVPRPDVLVATTLRRGPRVTGLVAEAHGAQALVVGADRRSLGMRMLTGNTTTGVAATAGGSVVVVPDGWEADISPATVVVGVKGPAHAAELLGEGFALADARGARLLVLHAWQSPSAVRSTLGDLVREWQAAYPDLDVEVRVVCDRPAHALVEAARNAGELVLMRRAHGVPAALHLGTTARAVLREAACPVRVVPPGPIGAVPGLVLEDAGTVRK